MDSNTLSTTVQDKRYGVYTLANDGFLDWFLGFIKSFRKQNPTLPLSVIPYNQSVTQLKALASRYNFTILEESRCAKFDTLAARVMHNRKSEGMFRKWAAFFGEYDYFLFIDGDTVVNMPFDELLRNFAASSYDFLFFDVCMQHVYTDEFAKEMVSKYGANGFNAGAFVARKGISEAEVFGLAERTDAVRPGFIPDQVDQPFLNYFFDSTCRRVAHAREVLPTISEVSFSGQPLQYSHPGDCVRDAKGKMLPFIHWAGDVFPNIGKKELYLYYRLDGLSFWERCAVLISFYGGRRMSELRRFVKSGLNIARKSTRHEWRVFYAKKLIGRSVPPPAS